MKKPGYLDVEFAKPLFGANERRSVMEVMYGSWLASGPVTAQFEAEFAREIGVPYAVAVNSGSAANLLALAALQLPKGSKVLTSGCGFPATLAPILHLGLEPVLVDYDVDTLNIDVDQAIQAMLTNDIKAALIAHTLGSPIDMNRIMSVANDRGVAVIEDCCEALGAKLNGVHVGAWGVAGTYSFYPSHQITALGGGGMLVTKSRDVFLRARSMRDWGKVPTWDKAGRTDTTYDTVVDGVPYFSHYTYETIGYNARLPEACSAFGLQQMKRLPKIVRERLLNHHYIWSKIEKGPWRTARPVKGAEPSWFGVALVLDDALDRQVFGDALESVGVRHRPFFAGNITRHKPFSHLRQSFPVADWLMKQALFVGCYAGMPPSHKLHVVESIFYAAKEARKGKRHEEAAIAAAGA